MMLKTKRGTVLEWFKYRFRERSMIIWYCSDFQQNCILESHFLYIDDTFDTAPESFEQVLVIMGKTSHKNLPISCILLPNKKQGTCVKAFTLFKHEVAIIIMSSSGSHKCSLYLTTSKKALPNPHNIQKLYFFNELHLLSKWSGWKRRGGWESEETEIFEDF